MLLMLLVAVFTGRRVLRVVMLVMFFAMFLATTNRGLYGKAERMWCGECLIDIDTTQRYDYAIVPGGVTSYDSVRGRVEYGEAGDRLVDCAWLMNLGVVDKVIVTGDGGSNGTGDSLFFRKHMKEVYGIDGDRVLIEPEAKNTIENFTKTQAKFGKEIEGKRVLVINSALYMRRTMLCCRKVELECDYYTVDIDPSLPGGWEDNVPDMAVLNKWMKLAHEWIGYVAYLFY